MWSRWCYDRVNILPGDASTREVLVIVGGGCGVDGVMISILLLHQRILMNLISISLLYNQDVHTNKSFPSIVSVDQ